MTQESNSLSARADDLRQAVASAGDDDVDSRLVLFRWLDRAARYTEALEVAEQLSTLKPRNAGFAQLCARTLVRLDRYDAAVVALKDRYPLMVERVMASL